MVVEVTRSMGGEPVLTTVDVARRLGVSVSAVQQWRKAGRLPAVPVPGSRYTAGQYVFRLVDVERLARHRRLES